MQTTSVLSAPQRTAGEHDLVGRLRAGDEEAYASVLDRYYSSMLHVALGFVSSRSVAEEVVQDTWLAVITGISRFQERCSFKTWLFRILVNRARSRGVREHRCVAFSTLADEPSEAWVPEDARGPCDAAPHVDQPGDAVLNAELAGVISSAINRLPGRQRQVLVLRDVEGWSATEVCDLLAVSEANQRVLLHRARTKIRSEVVPYLALHQAAPPVSPPWEPSEPRALAG
jgi:RNA polymerase sigma-70 factor (ECF subfamily)